MPDNYSMVLSWLQKVEKCLAKNPEVAKTYQEVIDKHLGKSYIRNNVFATLCCCKNERPSTKMCVVFDASAQHCLVSLTDVIHTSGM